MADVLDRARCLVVQQTLHGYADGHRLLVGSTAVKPRDAKTMLALSDLPGPGTKVEESGYLTGYPLPESGAYAFARTWAAHEMPRPGCVWTHSLLIDYADLATIGDPSQLLALLRRPLAGAFESYSSPIEISHSGVASLDKEDADYARSIVFALYEHAKKPIVASIAASAIAERLVLVLWAQQWARLRRTFRFCTFTTADRSSEEALFDLQFTPANERSARSRFSDAFDALKEDPPIAPWLEHALRDLIAPRDTKLREFLRQVAAEVSTGRDSFRSLTALHALIREFGRRDSAIDEAIALVERNASQSQSARIAVTTAALQVSSLGLKATRFVLRHLDDVGTEAPRHGERLTRALWNSSPAIFMTLLEGEGSASAAAGRVLTTLNHDELVQGIERAPEILGTVLERRCDVVTTTGYWRLGADADRAGMDHLAEHLTHVDLAIDAMIEAERSDMAHIVTRRFEIPRVTSRVARCLDRVASETVPAMLVEWVSACLRETTSLAAVLSQVTFHARSSLVALAKMMQPDSVPNDFGEDPWWTSYQQTSGKLSTNGDLYLSAFLLTRALGWRSRNQAEMLAATFDIVYSAASKPDMPDVVWRMMSPRMPSRYGLPDWDRCPRLRLAVVETFVDRDLRPAWFGKITASDALFRELVELAADTWRGRRYLRRVQRDLSDDDPRAHRRRLEMLDHILN